MAELLANRATTYLGSGINDTVTTLTVTGTSLFPVTGNFRVRIDDELIIVTNVSSLTWSITRGAEGTTAAAHATSAKITQVLTVSGLLQYITDNVPLNGKNAMGKGAYASKPSASIAGRTYLCTDDRLILRDTGSTWEAFGPVILQSRTAAASFTKVESDSDHLIVDYKGGQFFYGSAAAQTTDRLRARVVAGTLGTSYTLIGVLQPIFYPGADGDEFGICIRDSGTGEMVTVGVKNISGKAYICVDFWTTYATKDVSSPSVELPILFGQPIFLRIMQSSGILYQLAYSFDGVFWTLLANQDATFMTPDQMGLYRNPKNVLGLSGVRVLKFGLDTTATFN